MIKIILADDHQLIREGLKKIVLSENDISVIAEASNSAELISLLKNHSPDVLVLDVNMPGRSGLDVLSDLLKQYPKLKILILSMHPEDSLAVRALKSGACGYVTKDAPPEKIIMAIRKIAAGRKFVTETLAERLAANVNVSSQEPYHELLSDREFEVMILIGTGKTVSEIAVHLSLSVPTVSTYRTRILEKMKMSSNAELIHYAIRNKLIE